MKKSILLTALLVITAVAAQAQKTITFAAKPKSKTHKSHGRNVEATGKNSLSIGLVEWTDGWVPIAYDRMITDWFSAAVYAGPTTHPYLTDIGLAVYDEATSNGLTNNYESYTYRTVKTGFGIGVAPRFYYHESSLDGAYVSPTFTYKSYRFDAQKANETVSATSSSYVNNADDVPRGGGVAAETMRCLDLTAVSGGTYQLRHHINIGWTVGIGVRQRSSERNDIGMEYDVSTSMYHYTNTLHSYTSTVVLITFGFTVGGWW